MAEQYSFVYMYHNVFIHSSFDGHLGCFHVQATVTVLQGILGYMCLFQFQFPQGICLGSGIAGSHDGFISSFLRRSPYCLPWWLYQFTTCGINCYVSSFIIDFEFSFSCVQLKFYQFIFSNNYCFPFLFSILFSVYFIYFCSLFPSLY